MNHTPLIKLQRKPECIQLDTGNSTLGEIETAVDAIGSEGNQNIVIHQCPSGYPARIESVNLRIIPTLKKMFGFLQLIQTMFQAGKWTSQQLC